MTIRIGRVDVTGGTRAVAWVVLVALCASCRTKPPTGEEGAAPEVREGAQAAKGKEEAAEEPKEEVPRTGRLKPSVLFVGEVHSRYVARPLHELGVELDRCKTSQLAQRLSSGKHNVLVTGTLDDEGRRVAGEFMSEGGGVLVCNPQAWSETENWTATNEWLAGLGARPRWEVLYDADPENVVSDIMRCKLSWSDQVFPPVDEGVRGVLTLMWNGTTGCEPPMPFDIGPEWKVVVRGAPSMRSRRSKRHDEHLQPWMPEEELSGSPVLMAVRQVGKGRMAAIAIRYYWLFSPPGNCPTTEAMLTAGAGGKPSDWLRLLVNAFVWLAEPSVASTKEAGGGGASTPKELLNPPVEVWEPPPARDWTAAPPMKDVRDQPQVTGLIGARTELSSGAGTVADYVREAKASGLQFVVFLEDSLNMDEGKWRTLVGACDAASDDSFAAVPGLTYEDAQGNHLYAFADQVKFPKPDMLLEDGRLATNKSRRTKALFDYVNEYMRQKIISGYWKHDENFIHFADYKLYNSFPIYSFENGAQVDDALDEYAYLMGIGGCQAALAFEIMTSPAQVASRAKEGWKVVWLRSVKDLRGKWHHGAWSFHGMMSQYVTNGPRILVWQGPNRLVNPHGQWWRPDLWEFRIRLRAASEDGLRSVVIHDGDRGVFRRWLPGGAKTFETELVLSNCQQLGLFPVIEDTKGRKAVGMQSWNRNCIMEEFFCSDRCNFLGNARLRTRAGRQVWTQVSFKGNMGITPSKGRLDLSVQPAVCLTLDSPTLPIDGRPMGFPTVSLNFRIEFPGELPYLFAYPRTYLVGPEIAIGQADLEFAYDPAEKDAEKTPLGHPYEQPQHGGVHANAWGSWHRLVPTRLVSGWSRTYACNWLPEEFRLGWHETKLTTKKEVELDAGGLRVMYASVPGWVLHHGEEVIASPGAQPSEGPFSRGTFATLEHGGGSIVVVALEGRLRYRLGNQGRLSLHHVPEGGRLAQGDEVQYAVGFAGAGSGTTTARMLDFARKFGIAGEGSRGYSPKITRGRELSNHFTWRVDAEGEAVEAQIPRTEMPGFLPVVVEGLNDGWAVFLFDRKRDAPSFRALPVRDGRAFGQLDLAEADLDLFLGHPVTCDRSDVSILVAWQEPGIWFVEAHNPSDEEVTCELRSSEGWDIFAFREKVQLPPGTSRIWSVKGKQ